MSIDPIATDSASSAGGSNLPTPTQASGGGNATGGGGSTSLDALFPISTSVAKWTTFPGAPGALPLSDATLRPEKVESGMTHTYMAAPDGKQAMQAIYPKGSYIPSKDPKGGFSFYAPGPAAVDLTTAKEALFGYSVYFPENFNFVLGGKLPGLYGGDNATTAVSCSGGRRSPTCFSVRLMWRTDGAGELYTYLPDPKFGAPFTANSKMCATQSAECNPTYGASLGRGNFKWATGQWTTVSQRVKLNTVGQADGELELFVGGKSVISVTGVAMTNTDTGAIQGMQMQTFFGGSNTTWASPLDQQVYFSDFSVGILSK
ncbi:polysaccharide lyase family 14 protein [Mycena polygramma]|nr:polysaccharide lyase family 14 protein [Mycena polygramma]